MATLGAGARGGEEEACVSESVAAFVVVESADGVNAHEEEVTPDDIGVVVNDVKEEVMVPVCTPAALRCCAQKNQSDQG